MRRMLAVTLAGSLALAPVAVQAQDAAAPPAVPAPPAAVADPVLPAPGPAPGPALGLPAPASPEAAAADDAGGWTVNRQLMAVGAGAIVGIVAFNVLAAPLGTVPLAGGALAAVPYDVALGSRLIATLSGGAGALAATYAYDQWTGHETDYKYWLALGAGALGGVAVGNVLSAGMLGRMPYYVGAGADSVGVPMASAASQAFSRIAVIASGVMGAWVADWAYNAQ
ncbi:hypothetical protein [Azospirillum sp. ST 5-10]|uniref:hypothetical protein n=1 Tax=unclassified Azospirillum TaxID=2630922 RepID=UPI003F4A17F6